MNSDDYTITDSIIISTFINVTTINHGKHSRKIQGLLRPAQLMQYLRLNVVFPGGNKHISSGLYLVTEQKDRIDGSVGYKTTLQLTKISGD